jgi:hypothetical protein
VANPPFNLRLTIEAVRHIPWRYGPPPAGNANFAWLQHVLQSLAPGGRAAVVMPQHLHVLGQRRRVPDPYRDDRRRCRGSGCRPTRSALRVNGYPGVSMDAPPQGARLVPRGGPVRRRDRSRCPAVAGSPHPDRRRPRSDRRRVPTLARANSWPPLHPGRRT